jgi:hypothetical protein
MTKSGLRTMAERSFGNVVKAVVDIKKCIMAIDSDLHADEEAELLRYGSQQENLWGINLYPERDADDYIEFDSMINIRPGQDNMTRGVDNKTIQKKIKEIVHRLIR